MMSDSTANIHHNTPLLWGNDPRGLTIRTVAYERRDSGLAQPRISRQEFNAHGRLNSQWDSRLLENGSGPNLSTIFTLSAQPILTRSVDCGWRVLLLGPAHQLLRAWDGRHSQQQIKYDGLLRRTEVTEYLQNEAPSVTERLIYADSRPEHARHNQCGQLISQFDSAGHLEIAEFDIQGRRLSETRRFLSDLQTPDWSSNPDENTTRLEIESNITRKKYNALGAAENQTDARNNQQIRLYDIAGQLQKVQLKRPNLPVKTLLSHITYSATGKVEKETTGNGVQTTRLYEPESDRLIQYSVAGPDHDFQNCFYRYDRVGNICEIQDLAQPTRYFRNQRTAAVSTFKYDTRYQLIEATGRESVPNAQGPALPELHKPTIDPTRMGNYKQTFTYDPAGNLKTLCHAGSHPYTVEMAIDPASNRSLKKPDVGEPDFTGSFDSNGNLLMLSPGAEKMRWDARNRLTEVIQVARRQDQNDTESYWYDSDGQRLRKVIHTKTSALMRTAEVRFLPGLDIHYDADGETRHVVNIEASHSRVQSLHWLTDPPEGMANNQIRYNLVDNQGSCTLEVDEDAGLLTQEGYYAFGGTAWWAARSDVESRHKSIHYSGKTRDSSGLVYYGYRYYAPWLFRWINPDPAGSVDGLNHFRFCRNNPVTYKDFTGAQSVINGDGPDDIKLPSDMTPEQIETIQLSKGKGAMLTGTIVHQISLPKQFKLDNMSRETFKNAGPGTAFTAIANVYTGDIYFSPLESNARSLPPTNRTRTESFVTHTRLGKVPNPPIAHQGGGENPSHTQLAQRVGLDQKDAVGFALSSGLNRGIYNMTFMSRSSQNTPLVDDDSNDRLSYVDQKDLQKYKFVTESSGGVLTRTHQVSVLPPMWGNAIYDYLSGELGEDSHDQDPNVFASKTRSEPAAFAPPPPPPMLMAQKPGQSLRPRVVL